jgi:hypothetical protein
MKKNYIISLVLSPLFLIAQPGSESNITQIVASIPYQGFGESIEHLGTGEYKIFYDNIDGVLDKPIIFIDGFDPGDSRTISSMYSALDYSGGNLGDIVRNEGYDLIVLNFPTYTSISDGTTLIDGGADFIQRNAFILIELINTINAMKVGSEQNVVIGPSMGGLIARYALRYMEQNSMSNETRLYISFDSPHKGANIPISIQYMFSYLVNFLNQTEAEPGLNSINSAAAKQMLIDHYLGHVEANGYTLLNPVETLPTGAPNFRDAFQTELDAMGLPQTVRNVSIVNGSGLSTTTGTPGTNIINHTFNLGSGTNLNLNLNFTPAAGQTNTVTTISGIIFGFIPVNYSAPSESPATSDGLDSAPGGTASLSGLDNGSSAILTEFVTNLNQTEYNFIPTLSALDISDSNWYAIPNTSLSPFANTYIPSTNEAHVMLTDGNVAFALSEIRQTLNLKEIAENTFKLAKNPVDKTLTLLSTKTFENSKLTIVDILGNTVFSTIRTINNKTEIPIQLNTGLYILNIETLSNLNYKTKIIVK